MENNYLNEESLQELLRKVIMGTDSQNKDDQEILNDAIVSFHAYVDTVVHGEIGIQMAGHALEGQAYRDMISQYDQDRHNSHETAIVNVRVLNRIAILYGLGPVFTGDDTERHQIADFCLEIDQYFFRNRRMKLS